jgi:UDP-N-acetylmuramate dehydrogenase
MMKLIKEAKQTVKEKFDIKLDLEVKLLGFNAEEINEL